MGGERAGEAGWAVENVQKDNLFSLLVAHVTNEAPAEDPLFGLAGIDCSE